MRTSVYCGLSLDGFIARGDGSVGFLEAFDPATVNGEPDDLGFGAFMQSVDALVMGRNTFDVVLSMVTVHGFDWPYGDTPVIVMTRRPLDVPDSLHAVVEATDLEPTELLDVLRARFIDHVYVDGGMVVQSFLRAGLIDELILTRVPMLIGDGIPLFGALSGDVRLAHLETHTYSNGFVQSRYEVGSRP